jgi:hypothetical protein
MTSIPASRSAAATTWAPRSWPSSPGFAMSTRTGRRAAGAAGGVACGFARRLDVGVVRDTFRFGSFRVGLAPDPGLGVELPESQECAESLHGASRLIVFDHVHVRVLPQGLFDGLINDVRDGVAPAVGPAGTRIDREPPR